MKNQTHLSVGRNLKIGFFHLGSGMADIMTTGIWNRIMISDLGFAATPIGLLVSLRYFLAPLGVWAGRISDQQTVMGYHRLFWIWLGRAMMVISVFLLGFQTADLVDGQNATTAIWITLTLALLLFSLGNALSGSVFLALVYDRSSIDERGRAVGIVWTFLLLGFMVGGILFSVMLPEDADIAAKTLVEPSQTGITFTGETLRHLFLIAGIVLGSLWFFSLLGEEKRSREIIQIETHSISADIRIVWEHLPMRFFAFYLALSMIFAFSQDLVLEPFAADVFDMSPSVTTRFAAYWGSMSILGSVAFLVMSRRYKSLTNRTMSNVGVIILVITFGLFAVSALAETRELVTPGLITLGLGLGFWNIGTLGLMMDMSPFGSAGTFLGFWTLLVTLSRGIGVSGGGLVRDIALNLGNDPNIAYGVVFALGAFGLVIALYMLRQVTSNEQKNIPEIHTTLATSMD